MCHENDFGEGTRVPMRAGTGEEQLSHPQDFCCPVLSENWKSVWSAQQQPCLGLCSREWDLLETLGCSSGTSEGWKSHPAPAGTVGSDFY